MDDDDDSCLLDLIGDPQALNYFLHGPSNKSSNEDLTNAGYSAANSNSIFANSSNADPKSSLKAVSSQLGEGPSDGLPLSSSLQFLEDELESSPLPDLSEDQPFDILQKSLQEANITEQTLAEEAYLDASIGSSQQFAQAQLHPSSSASFTQASNISNYSGQTLQPIGVTHVPVGTSFASNTVGVHHGFMHHVGISVPSQHLSNSSQISGSGQIQLIGSFGNQPSMMTINNLDGSQIILKGSGQQAPSNVSGGLLVHRQTPNGNSLFGNSSSSPVAQPVTVPFNSTNFQTSLPVHNIIIQRGLAPNSNKVPINIQPKPIQMGQQNTYNVNNLGIQQHHVQPGISFASASSPQGSVVGPHMSVNIVNQQNTRKPVTSQAVSSAGGSIVIHSPMGQPHTPQSQFLIPTSLSVSSNSVHHVQTINGQLLQTQPSQLISGQVTSEHVMLNRNSSNMLRTNQPYSGQMLNNQNTAVQLVSGQTFAASGSPVIVNHASPQIVGGQMPLQQASPTVLHLSPGQSSVSQGRPGFATMPSVTSMSGPSRFPVVSSSSTAHPSLGAAVQSGASGSNFTGDQLTQPNRTPVPVSVSHRLPVPSSKSTSTFSNTPGAGSQQQFFCQAQKKSLNQTSPISASKTADGLRQAPIPGLLSTALPGQDSGSKVIPVSLGTTQPQQEKVVGSSPGQPAVQVDSHSGGQKRPAAKQLTKGAFILQQLQRDQTHTVTPDKSQFRSLSDAVQRLLSYHVCQGSMPTEEDLKKVDNEFETVATQLLKRTQAMLNKYRCLLLEDAMRINPSAEMVMIDRMFNQEERASLSRDKRLALVDPEGFQADFCCSFKLDKAAHETQFGRSDQHGSKTTSSVHLTAKAQSRDRAKPGMAEPTNHDQFHLVPNHIVVSAEGNIAKKTECLGRALKFDKMGSVQYRSASEEKTSRKDSVKGSECSPGPEGHRKNSSRPDHGPESKLSSLLVDSHLEMTCNSSFQDKTLRNSPKNEVLHTDIMKGSAEPQPDLQLTKSLETTFKNILELKKAGRQPQSDPTVSGSVELDFPNFSPMASQENCLEKFIPDHSEGIVETDSILEAAVNSILEC
ncbi:BRD4-interacting chromatin-remodeling complex-associated protein-like [Balaenoptera acutorostrata]|uniref:BRD4-interacting chromatin-remodeling complex-associated protein-like n=1 Tax=Balaenoptera acutorostrata TaxID=9767 RepID=A0A384BE00_BALAC|nr:BRD4-interacting chromatin-remodeling complex-associated protein-like [Balaenoptera acutorostrata]XP_057410398.1 BRD4-interacting chromatin-remodeling complex-associated protein-like [Balaenoptera acutorostrata]XP_057410399.1 BRD4-interacting chromatin-remodeling complex-associated protein-like [Balaenoptera acutorostrata]XP_057410400.1 BRD4-interacting chromatin-remodeling complex-associated protein-like [Balaenoptera acutorostrata]XP_057410401.1 BRD4-interacting chromatin-remodeling comple